MYTTQDGNIGLLFNQNKHKLFYLGRNEESVLADVMHSCANHAQSDSWEDVCIVALTRLVNLALELYWWEG